MKAIIFKLKPYSSFHFGKFAPDSDTALADSDIMMHSDSFFSAIINTYCTLFADTDEFVNQFKENNIKISSLFYYLELNDEIIWFLPKPKFFNLCEVEDHKKFKKISYISKRLYESIKSSNELLSSEVIILQDQFAIRKDELRINEKYLKNIKLYNSIVRQKVFVNKPDQGDDLFQLDVIEIADNSKFENKLNIGFYALYESNTYFNENFLEKFKICLDVLKSTGIGAEKSTLSNIEDIICSNNEWEIEILDPDTESAMNLSIFIPDISDIREIKFATTDLRGGRTLGHSEKDKDEALRTRLKVIRVVQEGAIIGKNSNGIVCDISPDKHNKTPFLRDGKPILISIKKDWVESFI